MNDVITLIKNIKDRKTLYEAKIKINEVATFENKEILMKALKNRIFEIKNNSLIN
jgi:hypothetical protein